MTEVPYFRCSSVTFFDILCFSQTFFHWYRLSSNPNVHRHGLNLGMALGRYTLSKWTRQISEFSPQVPIVEIHQTRLLTGRFITTTSLLGPPNVPRETTLNL